MSRKGLLAEFGLELEDGQEMFVCLDCLGDAMFRQFLNTDLIAERTCAACGKPTRHAVTPERIASFIGEYLPKHFTVDHGLYPGYELNLAEVVGKAILCSSDSVCKAIAAHLVAPEADEDDFYWEGQEYSRKSGPFESEEHERWYVVGEWQHIARELTHGRRFFNDRVKGFFEGVLEEALKAESPDMPGSHPVVRTLPEGGIVYRARLALSAEEETTILGNPATELGAPPRELAASNRMSPAGIPLLYAAESEKTCIAEVRPSIGDKAVVGKLQATRQLTFFDFNALDGVLSHAPLSLFDPLYEKRTRRRLLLRYLHDEIARPVRSNDIAYVVTQALAEFIRYWGKPSFDGVIFRSVQKQGGTNYVMFARENNANGMSVVDQTPRFDMKIVEGGISIHTVNQIQYASSMDGEGVADR